MNAYRSYMDRAALTQDQHRALMDALEAAESRPARRSYVNYFAMAACLGLVLAAAWGLGRGGASGLPSGPEAVPVPATAPVAARPNAKLFDGPADPGASYQADAAPAPVSQPPAVHIPHVEAPDPVQPAVSGSIEIDSAPARPPSTELTLEACRSYETLGAHVPGQVPSRFSFASGSAVEGEDPPSLSVLWTNGMEEIHVALTRPEEAPETMDVSHPEAYDVRLYSVPWCDSVPEEVLFGGFQDPVFRQEDLTAEVVAARGVEAADSGDAGGLRFTFSVLYPDGVVARYSMKGLTAREAAGVVLE